jgi:hypothetical protein
MKFAGFIGPTYQSASLSADAQRTLNLIPELCESGSGKNKFTFIGRPGLASFGSAGAGPIRCMWAGDNRLFVISGSTLYEVDSGGGATSLGSVGGSTSACEIHTNGNQLMIISDGAAYIANGVEIVSAPVPADPFGIEDTPAAAVGTASTGAFLDGYFIAAKPDSKTFFYSNILDGQTWDELDYLRKEGYPDNIEKFLTSHSELWALGDQTSEVFRNEGDADDAFRRDPGAFIHQGVVAGATVRRYDNGIAWIGGDTEGRCVAWRTRGFSPQRFSNHAVENAWAGYATVSDAVAYTLIWKGHPLYVVSFPTPNKTWVYDQSTNMWCEWSSGGNRFRGQHHAFVFGKHLVGDYATGAIYELSDSTYQDNGSSITFQRTAPYVNDEQHRLFFAELQLDVEAGLGTQSYTLEWSTDGGKTWSDPISASAGPISEYTKRVIWRRLGSKRDRIFRVTSTSNTKQGWTDAYMRLIAGTS